MTTFDYTHVNSVDVALEEMGHRRRIAMASTNFIANLKALQNTDLILTTPTRLAALIYQGLHIEALAEFQLPFVVPEISCTAVWHRRTEKDAANQWLRKTIFRLVKSINIAPYDRGPPPLARQSCVARTH